MATIGDDRMIVCVEERADGSWLFTICYTAEFVEADLGRRFDDSVQIFELQRAGLRPAVTGSPVSFRATSPRVFRKKRIVVHRDAHGELHMVRAAIRLYHRAGDDVVTDDEQITPPGKAVRFRAPLVKVSHHGRQRFA